MSNHLPASSQLDMFGEIDYSLPNPHGSSFQNIPQILPGKSSFDISQQSDSSSNFNSHYSSIDLFLNNLNIMPSFTNNNTTYLNTSLSTNISLNSPEKTSNDEASDYLLYLIIPLYSLVFIIGTIGNILVILTVVTVKQMRNTTNALILHLAIANLSFILMCIPHTIYVYVVHSYYFPRLLCKIANTLMYLSAYVSIYILVLMSIDRFLGVVFAVKSAKYRTERNAHLAVVIVWLVGIIFASPNMIYYDVLLDPTDNVGVCLFRGDSPFLNTARRVTAYCFALLGLIVPLIIIAILYGLIIKVLRQNAQGQQVAKGKKRVTKMISAVISSFVICWTPMQIYLLYTHHNQVIVLFAIVSQSLVYISACINPILYAFLSKPFRQAFQQFLTCSKLISNYFLSHNGMQLNAPRKSSSYHAIQQHSITRKTSSNPLDNDVKMKKLFLSNDHHQMSDLNSETITITKSSDLITYNRISNTNPSSNN